ncbi:hypothetical protein A2Y83_01355 [Candidatus Falkowbacteria bacterium RBG_13_39_14]|uniref:Uncharacterized protein n=1 Tax=Candidatus Falkowbacteria bacterium RBG_13_39_14 TaxID=1797985 RepID=A0A1F5S9F2_9BACT|nr:MAG: hypothetical protein A2Y83_01355 [Candidatus Falkowbacteria bacterium RBG_13_39_14]
MHKFLISSIVIVLYCYIVMNTDFFPRYRVNIAIEIQAAEAHRVILRSKATKDPLNHRAIHLSSLAPGDSSPPLADSE